MKEGCSPSKPADDHEIGEDDNDIEMNNGIIDMRIER